MKPILRATFLILIFLAFNGLFLWQYDITNFLEANISQFLPKSADKIAEDKPEIKLIFKTEQAVENQNSTTTGAEAPVFSLTDIQEKLDDISEEFDVVTQKATQLLKENSQIEVLIKEEATNIIEEATNTEENEVGQEVGQSFCEITSAASSDYISVVFNEIAWMGSWNSTNDEWLELKNISYQPVDLSGWQILSQSGNIKVIFPSGAELLAGGFWLLERTNDGSVPDITADFIYTGALKNSNEVLYFFDSDCQLQDKVEAIGEWPAGDKDIKRTMERKSDLTWQTSMYFNGTPKRENSSGFITVFAGGGPPPAEATKPVYLKILISEIQIAGTISEKDDFVELYNPNPEDLDLTDWYLQRKTASATDFSTYAKKDLFSGQKIPAQNYFLIANASSSFSVTSTTTYPLTEDNTIYLKNPNGEVVDKVGWGLAQDFETAATQNPEPGKSIARIWSSSTESYIDTDNNQEDFEIQTPTPKEKNKSPENQLPQAVFVFSPQNQFVNDEILFDAASSTDTDGQITTYFWDFNDNISLATDSAVITHSFATSGDFIVSLRVVDNLGATSSSATATISVLQKLVASTSVVISEIAWMGNSSSSANEWLELYNNTDLNIDLAGWKLISLTDNSPDINLSGVILAFGYYLLERTDDNTVENIPADLIYTGPLNNDGEKLELRDAEDNLFDLIDCSAGWFAGDNSIKQTMERINTGDSGSDSENWKNSEVAGGTPKSKNSVLP